MEKLVTAVIYSWCYTALHSMSYWPAATGGSYFLRKV